MFVDLTLGLCCDGFILVFLVQILTNRPFLVPPLKFKFKSRRGLVHVCKAVTFVLPGLVILLSPFVDYPAGPIYVWQSSVAVWFVVLMLIGLRRFDIPFSVLIFSIVYFVLSASCTLVGAEGWMLPASGASAISACTAVFLMTLQGVKGIKMRRNRPTDRYREISREGEEDDLLLPKSIDEICTSGSQPSTLPPAVQTITGLSLLTFSYMDPVIKVGESRQVQARDLPPLATDLTAQKIGKKVRNVSTKRAGRPRVFKRVNDEVNLRRMNLYYGTYGLGI